MAGKDQPCENGTGGRVFAKAPSGQRQVISRHRKAKCDCSRVRRKAERK